MPVRSPAVNSGQARALRYACRVADRESRGREGQATTSPGVAAVLVFLLIAGSFLLLMPLVVMAIEPTVLPGGLGTQQQDAETVVYLLTYFMLLPAWTWAGLRLIGRIDRGPGPEALSVVTGLLALAFGLLLVVIRCIEEVSGAEALK